MKKENVKFVFTPYRVFLYGLIFLLLLMFIQLPLLEGKVFFSMLHSDRNDTFMDFFNSIIDAGCENPYVERRVIYPALTYVFYGLCSLLLPSGKTAFEWRNSQQGIIVILVITIVTIVLLHRTLLSDGHKNDSKARNLIWWILLGTVPFWYAMERGNLVLLTLLLLAYFVKYYKSENKIKKEMALICLAIAVSFKVYPVFFGLFLIMNKQFKEAIRCVIYGVIAFVVPFFAYDGVSTIITLIENLTRTTGNMATRGWGYKANIDNTINFLSEALHIELGISSYIKVFCAILMIIIFSLSKKLWQQYMVLVSIMILFPGFSYSYTLIFVALPLTTFLLEEPSTSIRNLLFSLLFLGMLAPFPLGGEQLFDLAPLYTYNLNLTTLISSISIILMICLIFFDVIYERIGKNEKKIRIINLRKFNITNTEIVFLSIVLIMILVLIIFYLYCDNLYNVNYYNTF